MDHSQLWPLAVGVGSLLVPAIFAVLIRCICSTQAKVDVSKIEETQTLQYTFPILKSTLSFLFDGLNLFLRIKHLQGDTSVSRIALVNDDIYVVQGQKYITEVFKTTDLAVTVPYSVALRSCFGMSRKAAEVYVNDTSGSHNKSIPNSSIKAEDRIGLLTHQSLLKTLVGAGFAPTYERFELSLSENLSSQGLEDEWMVFPDFLQFFEVNMGPSVLKCIFGSALLSENPTFISDLWAYDKAVMGLIRHLPVFCIPKAYRLRRRVVLAIKKWHTFARAHDEDERINKRKLSDEVWGSGLIRERNKMLQGISKQDQDSVASTDFALIWASITNVVPSAMSLVLHAFSDPALLSELRSRVANAIQPGPHLKFCIKTLEKEPLLNSMFAETLRFGVQIHIPRVSPHIELQIGNKIIPKNKLIFINTWLAHTDKTIWNTKGDLFPLSKFWPQRFLIDPMDSSTGPTREFTAKVGAESDETNENGVHFSTEGLEGAWIPFGGGHHMCPGRILARRMMLLTCAMMITMFDIEFTASDKNREFSSSRFGFGVRKPKGEVRFLIRKRKNVSHTS